MANFKVLSENAKDWSLESDSQVISFKTLRKRIIFNEILENIVVFRTYREFRAEFPESDRLLQVRTYEDEVFHQRIGKRRFPSVLQAAEPVKRPFLRKCNKIHK